MKQIICDGKPFTYGDSLEAVSDFSGIELSRLSFNLDDLKKEKIEEIYHIYQSEKLNGITSSLRGVDGRNIVFEYNIDNQNDYTKIGVTFVLDETLEESIIGSKSHGKFFISREDYKILASELKQHETNLYIKFKDLKTKVENATKVEELDTIVW